MALQSDSLAGGLGNFVACGWLGDWSALATALGRALFLFGFNAFVAGAVCLGSGRRLVRGGRARLYLLLMAVAAIAAPWIADLGSGAVPLPVALQPVVALAATVLSQGALWALVFMLTGVVLDGMRREPPSAHSIWQHGRSGLGKGMVFSGLLVTILFLLHALVHWPLVEETYRAVPWLVLSIGGAVAFPLSKTLIESFNGSQSFFRRAGRAYRTPLFYVRGIAVGLGAWYALSHDFFALATARRIELGTAVGVLAYAGVSLLGDALLVGRSRGRIRSWRAYLVEALLGGFIGAGLGFYLDTSQVPVVLKKFQLYNSFGLKPVGDDFYPLLSKWGRIQLGPYAGGAKLLFNESLKGVIGWGVAAWLFAVNRSLLLAIFQRKTAPLRRMFSREGMAELTDGTVHVLRWGLWMAPIIFTFLRQMPVPTWYNQDGAIHTGFCIVNDLTMKPEQFREWSLRVFTWVLGYDLFCVLIWLDHIGLRVATLVNLSFLGMDRLDEKAARFVRPWATARFIPEGVKRFTTWAPLLIPFYIPAGADWDWAWTHGEAIQQSSHGIVQELLALPGTQLAWLAIAAGAAVSLASFALRRATAARPVEYTLAGALYAVTAKASGELQNRLASPEYDVTRRSYEALDSAGCALFLTECTPLAPREEPAGSAEPEHPGQTDLTRSVRSTENARSTSAAWPVVGNYPEEFFIKSRIEGDGHTIRITNQSHEIRATVTIRLPNDAGAVAAELWEITLENLGNRPRVLRVVPYLEWVLATPGADRGHTQYNRLFPEMSYEPELNAVLALHRATKKLGVLAADRPPRGFLTSRLDFVGRAGSVWSPGCLEMPFDASSFIEPHRAEACPTFDPIGSLLVDIPLEARGSGSLRLLIGCADDKDEAADWVRRYVQPSVAAAWHEPAPRQPRIGHGRIPPGTPQPYCEFADGGRRLRVHTPLTPRPFDHAMANALGHVLSVTNRGLHSSASVNAQQNRITPDWADTATSELPSEAFYLYDPESGQWFSPTYLPLRDNEAAYSAEFGVDGTATFRMERPEIATELTAFVPPHEPAGVYLLTVTNRGPGVRRLRLAPYFEIALAQNPENAGPLKVDCDRASGALFFENRRNTFRSGPAFAAMSHRVERVATRRGDFFGPSRSLAHPMFVVSDYTAINELVAHGTAENEREAARQAFAAGVDMDMQSGAYDRYLGQLVAEGKISQTQIDEAVRRILRLKFMLGLFDDPYRYCDREREKRLLGAAAHREATYDMACRSMVLLKNGKHTLPLKPGARIALIGPLAQARQDLLGSWSGDGDAERVEPVLAAVTRTNGGGRVSFARGCDVDSRDRSGFAAAVKAASQAEVVVMVLGESQDMSGEAASRTRIGLPGVQSELVEAIAAAGKPLVLVLMNGRPLALEKESTLADAILEAWYPGSEGARAVADMLFGKRVPSGKLPVTFPRCLGQTPIYYGMKRTGRPMDPAKPGEEYVSRYLDCANDPLYPFGFGLSYTTFAYSDLKLSAERLRPGEQLTATATVRNTGSCDGAEVVQLYIQNLVGSVTRPVRELKGFRRIELRAGESRAVTFSIGQEELRSLRGDMTWGTEPGKYRVLVGPNSRDLLSAPFELVAAAKCP